MPAHVVILRVSMYMNYSFFSINALKININTRTKSERNDQYTPGFYGLAT
jgi:hypothetical protein